MTNDQESRLLGAVDEFLDTWDDPAGYLKNSVDRMREVRSEIGKTDPGDVPVPAECRFQNICSRTAQCESWLRSLEGCQVDIGRHLRK